MTARLLGLRTNKSTATLCIMMRRKLWPDLTGEKNELRLQDFSTG
jgi:hypothetical protein